jgi:hypothetical protein
MQINASSHQPLYNASSHFQLNHLTPVRYQLHDLSCPFHQKNMASNILHVIIACYHDLLIMVCAAACHLLHSLLQMLIRTRAVGLLQPLAVRAEATHAQFTGRLLLGLALGPEPPGVRWVQCIDALMLIDGRA